MKGGLIILVGPKGAGKTHIGQVLERRTGIKFFPTEKHWMEIMEQKPDSPLGEKMQYVHSILRNELQRHQTLIVETIGKSEIFDDLLSIDNKAKLVKITASWDSCISRITTRNQSVQIQLPFDKLKQYYEFSSQFDIQCDIEIDNDIENQITDDEILLKFSKILHL